MNKFIHQAENWLINVIAQASERADGDVETWQRQIETRFMLELNLESNRFSLYDDGRPIVTFIWKDIIEIQQLHRKEFCRYCGISLLKVVAGKFPSAAVLRKRLPTAFMRYLATTRNR